ncbi:hypothetical protein E2C01_031573 [Portunus trituberculatus]|uniref:Uncharacterized protein n=1 Tax=Portunus trituberculatus TaxID=210409 RepID=A0A5B7ETU1_PORTR|nr:hypothetical protein [Portunus trituberculatus]
MEIKTVLLLGRVTAGFTTRHSTVTCVAGVESGTRWINSEDVAHPPVLTSLMISRGQSTKEEEAKEVKNCDTVFSQADVDEEE